MNRQLYIIGNGFDLHHGLDTWYSSFGAYLENENPDLYELLVEHIGAAQGEDLWSNFEANLANLKVEKILGKNAHHLPNYAAEEFRDRDRYDFEYAMKDDLELLTEALLQEFRNFIEAVEIPDDATKNLIQLDPSARFLNFNYTDTLQKLYGVPESSIRYIHNAASDKSQQIILGHGIEPEKLKKEKAVMPDGLSEEQQQEWIDDQADQYDYSYDRGETMIRQYFGRSFKNTRDIISKHADFFSSLANIERVTVMGHSISPVDIQYFRAVAGASPNCQWEASYRSDGDKQLRIDALQSVGVDPSKISLFKMTDYLIKY